MTDLAVADATEQAALVRSGAVSALELVDADKSVIAIAHHQAVMAHADWIIDLGPGAGHDGGRIVFEGTPADLVAAAREGRARATLTGEHLAAYSLTGSGPSGTSMKIRPSATITG